MAYIAHDGAGAGAGRTTSVRKAHHGEESFPVGIPVGKLRNYGFGTQVAEGRREMKSWNTTIRWYSLGMLETDRGPAESGDTAVPS